MQAQEIKITQTRSTIGCSESQRRVLKALGLKKRGCVVQLKDNNCIRGMINKIHHLVSFELGATAAKKTAAPAAKKTTKK